MFDPPKRNYSRIPVLALVINGLLAFDHSRRALDAGNPKSAFMFTLLAAFTAYAIAKMPPIEGK